TLSSGPAGREKNIAGLQYEDQLPHHPPAGRKETAHIAGRWAKPTLRVTAASSYPNRLLENARRW
ncbi:MAG TPA: hypothetical protein VK395_20830, partial [Gemmataceae bacterium]|nr:hypothetical protein [Gemmataceae bacterium]